MHAFEAKRDGVEENFRISHRLYQTTPPSLRAMSLVGKACCLRVFILELVSSIGLVGPWLLDRVDAHTSLSSSFPCDAPSGLAQIPVLLIFVTSCVSDSCGRRHTRHLYSQEAVAGRFEVS